MTAREIVHGQSLAPPPPSLAPERRAGSMRAAARAGTNATMLAMTNVATTLIASIGTAGSTTGSTPTCSATARQHGSCHDADGDDGDAPDAGDDRRLPRDGPSQ